MKLGVQLYTLREELAADFDGVIAALGALDIAGVEPWGGISAPVEHAAAQFAAHGLAVPSSHLPLLTGDDGQKWLDAAAAWGVKTIVLPWLPESDFADEDALKRTADKIAASAQVAQAAGFQYGYHNHWFEWTIINGRPAIDQLAEMLDPSIVFEIDLYWAKVAGYEPAAVLKQFGARVSMVHLKDGPAQNTADPMVAAGEGAMDFAAIAEAATADWGFIELDRCATDMLEAVTRSAAYFNGKGYATGKGA